VGPGNNEASGANDLAGFSWEFYRGLFVEIQRETTHWTAQELDEH